MINLFLIRHGETDWIGKKLAGRLPNISLNVKGRAQAHTLAAGLAQIRLNAVHSSPLERTRETAAQIAQEHGLTIQLESALLEMDFGDWTGKTFDELGGMEAWRERLRTPSLAQFPGGESLQDVQRRGVAWVEQISRLEGDRSIAAFSHADTIRLVLAHFLCMPLVAFQSLTVETASVSILHIRKTDVRVIGVNWPASAAGEIAAI
jgi:broad specificity phosphatase PhoE